MAKPLAIDLFCGLGGWTDGFLAEGYRVIGYDIKRYPGYAGELVLQDVRTLDGRRFRDARCIVGSSPCQKLTQLNFLHPPSQEALAEAVYLFGETRRIAEEAGVPWVAENVQGAQRYVGEAAAHRGPWYLWGDVPILFDGTLPAKVGAVARARVGGDLFKKDAAMRRGWNAYPGGRSQLLGPARLKKWGARDRGPGGAAERARIPLRLARAVARGFL